MLRLVLAADVVVDVVAVVVVVVVVKAFVGMMFLSAKYSDLNELIRFFTAAN